MTAITVLGVVVAGGRGRRLGAGVPKALAMVGGSTLLERALATINFLADEIVVCAPASIALPVDPAQRVCDAEPGEGPLAGLVAALASRTFRRAVVLGVDMPLLTYEDLAAVSWAQIDKIAAVPAPGGRPQPLAAWYAPEALPPLAAALRAGERALVPAVMSLAPVIVKVDAWGETPGGPDAWLNLNTPDDLVLAERALAQRGAA